MVKILKKKYSFLRDLSQLSKRDREKYLKTCCEENIHTVCEAVDNVLKNVCSSHEKSTKNKKNLLNKDLKKLANYKTKVSVKRKLLTNSQTGAGVFSIIASAVLPFLASLLAKRS